MNKINPFVFLILTCLFFCLPVKASAAEMAEELMPKLSYDVTSQRLTGETAPNANISFSAFVGDIVADDEGKFELPIPAEIKQSQIRIDDYLNNLYLELDFDFTTGTIATSTEISTTVISNSSDTSKTNQVAPEQTSHKTPNITEPPTATKTDRSIILWVLLLVLIVSGTVVGLLYAQKKKAKKRTTKKKRRSHKKGTRRKKRKSSRK